MQFAQVGHDVRCADVLGLHAEAYTDLPASRRQAEAADHAQPIGRCEAYCTGRMPRAAHVRRFSGCKKKPDSSIKAMLA